MAQPIGSPMSENNGITMTPTPDAQQLIKWPSEAQIEGLRQFVGWHGAAHTEDCPADDTCECACKPLNDAVNSILSESFDRAVTNEVAAFQARLDALYQEQEQLRQERDEAMKVLAPNVPESGLIDACRQVKQAAISEADNAEKAESEVARLTAILDQVRAVVSELDAELHRIGQINTADDRDRVVPELTVYIWLQKAKALCADELTARLTEKANV